jgi:hypothetical protein
VLLKSTYSHYLAKYQAKIKLLYVFPFLGSLGANKAGNKASWVWLLDYVKLRLAILYKGVYKGNLDPLIPKG